VSGRRLDRADALRLLAVAAAGAAGAIRDLAAAEAAGFPRPHAAWRFVFVNHAVTNPFFRPARYGIADAASLLGVRWEWTGSRRSNVAEMVAAMRKAIRTRADGIAVSIIDPTAFDAPTAEAIDRRIPVIAYNADGSRTNRRLAYVGQDLYQAGLTFGARIVELVGAGDVALFIATPGQLNIQPRIDGARDAIKDSGAAIAATVVATGADVREEPARIEAALKANPHLRGLFAVDGGSTAGVANVMRRHGLHRRGVRGGGFDLLPDTLQAIADGLLDFTIDQQPYLQGFLPTLQLFLDRYSDGLVAPADTNTGLKVVTRTTVGPYLNRRSRFEGSS
jgi:simple sugar transport system substrate-binding protein